MHTPGLKVVAPGTPADAKGLLIAAIRDDNPVIYFESKPLYRTMKGRVPAGEHIVPIGQANVARQGDALSIITYGTQVRESLAAAERLADEQIECEVLDLRTLKPLDTDAILASVRRTSKALVVHSANQLAGSAPKSRRSLPSRRSNGSTRRSCASAGSTRRCHSARRSKTRIGRTAQTIYQAAKKLASY